MVTTLGPAGVYMLFILGAAGLAGASFKVAQMIKKEMGKHESKAARNKRLDYLRGVKEYEKSLGREHTELTRIAFRNGRGETTKYNFEEVITFDEEKDKVYRGQLIYYTKEGVENYGDIYLFQPRLLYKTHSGTVTIVPNDIKGTLKKGEEYKYRNRDSQDPQDVFVGYTPKREILSRNRFDFVKGEYRHCIDAESDDAQKVVDLEDQELRQLIIIEMDRDPAGNLIPVNLQDPQERARLEAYKEAHLKKDPTGTQYGNALVDLVRKAKAAIKGGYSRLIKGQDLDQSGVKAAEAAKQQQAQQQAKPEESAQIREYKRTQQRIRNAYDYGQMGKEIDRSSDGIEGNMMTPPPMPNRPPMGGGPRRR